MVSPRERFDWMACSMTSRRARAAAVWGIALMAASVSFGCQNAPMTNLTRLVEARRLAADVLVQFTKSADAGNRAVMADSDEASVAFAREAEEATKAVLRDTDALRLMLRDLGYSKEADMLEEFNRRFSEYLALDKGILELAVENTNLKAQRLSFGPAQEAADAFRNSLEAVVPAARTEQAWHVQALVATAVAAVRAIQVLQAPHIAESDDAAMARLEKKAADSDAAARRALETLASLVKPDARPQLALATAALDRFTGLNAQIVALSRRNSNVRSLALSLGQKRMLTAACEDSLRALQDALAKRGFPGTR
jgi:hypothetical protein